MAFAYSSFKAICCNTNKITQSRSRLFSKFGVGNYSKAYEGDGKTKVQILNKELDIGLMINSYNQYGFRLNNNMSIVGPMAIFSKSVLSWNVNEYRDINEDSLSLFGILEPKLDILVIGIGNEKVTPEISQRILNFIKNHKINIEILRTEQACTTFNFLNAESRMVAGAFIPPKHISVNEDDLFYRNRKTNLYDGQ
ncbi:NADH dehydrogenase [ubiquinone] 1 alpha subcomplex assembly factor 3 [Condylostylus longicornis]|uniref:NADH dehydrogenase [ubiquinone] 1 alpha subcomplex assembly factor 3 n=1 Tax=Condylostylus longicornis TaxID=2530218 RepID=UPI00244E325E|nr:NADH dehydrogenase [ubiquinone] 1 alpha subcomplex assembly factor 3 [Condylostylus longicornis]